MRQKPIRLMLVGLGGCNGSTLVAGLLANKHSLTWQTKNGTRRPNFYGSLSQSATIKLGDSFAEERYFAFKDVLPMVSPNDLVLHGWDLSSDDLSKAMSKSESIDYDLQRQLAPKMAQIKPLKGVYYPDFIASNQRERVDHALPGETACVKHLEQIRSDIRTFKKDNGLDTVVVVWTANTERFSKIQQGVHDTEANMMEAIRNGNDEIAPSQIFALASIQENCTYINGSPQNTFTPAIREAASSRGVFLAGSDFKSGQTKLKSVLVDFLVGSGLRPESIVSYNHLGNNDGRNLSSPSQFESKRESKSKVINDILLSNEPLTGSGPDHTVVIKYVPFVGDSKRAMDEYVSSIFLGGLNTLAMHNTCEDSLLAAPIILDLALFSELFSRVHCHSFPSDPAGENGVKGEIAREMLKKAEGEKLDAKMEASFGFKRMNSIVSALSFLVKAPETPEGEPVVNSLFRQRACLENLFRAVLGMQPETHMFLEHKFPERKGC